MATIGHDSTMSVIHINQVENYDHIPDIVLAAKTLRQ